MSSTLYSSGTVVTSNWLNDADTATYNYLTAVAGTNAITATGPVSMLSYTAGDRFYLKPVITNTGATTINISGLGVQPITKNGSVNLVAGDLVVGHVYEIVYDGSLFQLLNPSTVNLDQVIPVTNGGTGAITAAAARTNLSAASSGANSDITSLSGLTTPLSIAQGGTGDTGTAWTSASVGTISSTTGSIADANGTRRTKSIGKTVFFSTVVQIVNNGTGATGLSVANAVPVAPIVDVIIVGRETQTSGNLVQYTLQAGSTTASIFSATNTYPGANNVTFKFNGCYESV